MKENSLHLHQEQTKKLTELGSRLQRSREEQSVSIEEVAAQTRISPRLLKAIEDGQLDQLPEPVYIQGFIRRFAEALGLNGAEFANAFPTGPAGFQFLRPSWRSLPAAQLRPIHLYWIYVVLVICAVSGLSHMINRSAMQVRDLETYPEPEVNGNQPRTNPTSMAGAIAQASQQQSKKPSRPVQVGVTLEAQSWLRVVADGKTEFEGVLPEGTQRIWVADEKLIVRAGNAGGVTVSFNEEKGKKLGAPGQVQEVIFKANTRS